MKKYTPPPEPETMRLEDLIEEVKYLRQRVEDLEYELIEEMNGESM